MKTTRIRRSSASQLEMAAVVDAEEADEVDCTVARPEEDDGRGSEEGAATVAFGPSSRLAEGKRWIWEGGRRGGVRRVSRRYLGGGAPRWRPYPPTAWPARWFDGDAILFGHGREHEKTTEG